MKSKHLLLTLLMALLVPWAASAQETLTVYDGTTGTLTSNAYVPMYGNYFDAYTKSEFVIPADQLSDMDGGTITSLKFYIQTVGTYGSGWSSNQQVFLKEVSSTSLSAFSGTDDATIVWEGSFTVPSSSDTEFEITFTTPYEYQGGNLLVGIYNITKGGYRNVAWYGQTVNGASGSGNTSSSLSSVSFSQKNFIPKTTFTYEAAAQSDCEKPETVTASQITPNTAMLNWEGGSTPGNGYNVEIKGGQYADWTPYASNISQGCQLTQLIENTAYQVRVQVVCSATETSPWRTASFSTPAYFSNFNVEIVPGQGNKAIFSWTENGFTPSDWQLCINGDEENLISMTSTPFTYDGLTPEVVTTAKMRAFVGNNTGAWSAPVTFTPTDSYVITVNEGTNTNYYIPLYYYTSYYTPRSQFIVPSTDLATIQWASINKLTFYYNSATSNYGTADFSVYVTEVNYTTMSAFADWTTLTNVYTGTLSVSGNKMVIEFSRPYTYSGGNLLIGFYTNSTGSSGTSSTWVGTNGTSGCSRYYSYSESSSSFLPKMTIEYTPGEAPSCLPPTGLDVVAAGQDATVTWESDATKWQVAHAMSATANPDDNIEELVSTKSFTMNDLPLGDHYFWVRTYCSETDQSMWAGPASVHIGYCLPAPSSTDGNGISNITFGIEPNVVNNDTPKAGYADYTTQIGAVQAGVEADVVITYGHTYTYGTFIWVDLNKDLDFEDEGELLFFEVSAGSSTAPHTLTAHITIPATQAVGDYVMRIGGGDDLESISDAAPCYTGTWAAFQDYTLRVLEAPSCLTPTNLVLSRNNDKIRATWESEATSFNIDINGTVTENVPNPYIFTAELSTTYTVKVQANCTGDETSDWSSPKSITTPGCWNGHVFEYTLTDSANDGWEGASITVIEDCDVLTTLNLSSGSSTSGTLNLCGDYVKFIYNASDNWNNEHSWTFTENGETIFSGNGSAYDDGEVLYTIGTQLPKPTSLNYGTPDLYEVELTWVENGTAETWQLCINGDEEHLLDVPSTAVTINEGTVTYTLGSLTENTPYTVKVRAYTTEIQSCWSNEISFSTQALCPVPVMDEATNIGHYTAIVSWTDAGNNDPYTVSYRVADHYDVELTEDFSGQTPVGYNAEGGELPNGWYSYNSTSTAPAPRVSNNTNYNHGGMSSSSYQDGNFLLLTTTANSQSVYAIMPQYSNLVSVSFDYVYESTSYGTLSIGYVTNNMGYTTYQDLQTPEKKATKTHFELTATDIATINANNGYIAFCYVSGSGTYYAAAVDNIAIAAGNFNDGGVWNEVPATAINGTTASLSGLSMGTKYEVKVATSCDSESNIVSFTTVSENEKYFLGTESDEWLEAGNWEPAGAPTFDQTVELRANTTITGVAFAKSISQGNYTITIEDGGKLKHHNSGVVATVKKNISGYENYTGENNGGYYLIANPMTSSVTPSADNGFLTGNFDLYNWNYNDINNEDNEWLNYEASSFDLNSGAYGYLYANETGTTLTYTGTINAYTGNKSRSTSVASNPDSYDFPSWYLLGNPYMYDAYLANASTNGTAMAYYRMNEAGDRIVPATAGTPIAPMEGFFYQGVTGATYAYVVTYEPAVVAGGELEIVVSKGRSTEDNAIIVFGGNQSLGKMSFRANSTKLYMPVDNKDYAIVSTESNVGEMPVSFKAENNGTYTLSFSSQEVSFSYLHLIDNMTGADVNLLKTPSYTFDARTTDYASRFRLVFATGSSAENDNFGFINGMGNLCIFGIEGEATLQVVDVLGHVISSNQFSGSYEQKLNVAPGVYMLRLINGNDVKVQKMVIK